MKMNKITATLLALVMLVAGTGVMGGTSHASAPVPPIAILGLNVDPVPGSLDYVDIYVNNVTNKTQLMRTTIAPNGLATATRYRYTIGTLTTGWIPLPYYQTEIALTTYLSKGEGVLIQLEM